MIVVLQIGTEFFRGVSGGERKRTNIGMELIIKPQVLFLDEPTTGLDAHTAVSVVKLLKRYAHHIHSLQWIIWASLDISCHKILYLRR